MAEYHYSYKIAPDRHNNLCPAELRFIEAFNTLQQQGLLSLNSFASATGANLGTFHDFRRGSNRKARVEWLSYLCEQGVSADWLLTGKGQMLSPK